jgi:hypothetical protein
MLGRGAVSMRFHPRQIAADRKDIYPAVFGAEFLAPVITFASAINRNFSNSFIAVIVYSKHIFYLVYF